MASSPSPPSPPSPMATKSPLRSPKPSLLSDALLFSAGAFSALLLFWSFSSFLSPLPTPLSTLQTPSTASADPPAATFYDDPTLSYTLDGPPIKDWDEKRRRWLSLHPSFRSPPGEEKVLMVTGSQSTPCRNPIGDHLLLRFYKNKADYCRHHGLDLFYNTALLEPSMFSFWAKIPAVRAAMVAHPEAEWLWWVDSDAALTDMDFRLPLRRYAAHNLVLHGWPHLVLGPSPSWTGLNAGVFLLRNCQWSLDLIAEWAKMGPQSPDYDRWGKAQKALLKDKLFKEADDQSGLIYLLNRQGEKWSHKVYLENEFYFEGYWLELIGKLENITERYLDMERRAPRLRRRRAEGMGPAYGRMAEAELESEGLRLGPEGWRRPFITHFTGCQPCSGDHNKIYSGENCMKGMEKVLNFADDQVLRAYGYRHDGLLNTSGVRPVPFDFPAAGRLE